MCGRYSLVLVGRDLLRRLDVEGDGPAMAPQYNVAPGAVMPIITQDRPRQLTMARWGFAPTWQRQPGRGVINARAETLFDKPYFRSAAAHGRCLIPADGFFEWQAQGKMKQPWQFTRRNRALMLFAGVCAPPPESGQGNDPSYAIVTTAANATVGKFHDRMPVIFSPADGRTWLSTAISPAKLTQLCRPFPDVDLTAAPVSPRLNRARENDPSLIEPISRP